MKRISIYLLAASVALVVTLAPVQSSAMTSSLGWVMNDYEGTEKSPVLTGNLMLECSNITITLAKDRSDIYSGRNIYNFRSADGGVYFSTWDGSWSLNLAAHNFTLENGYYTARVSCDDARTYTTHDGRTITYYLNDIFEDVIYVYPESCDETFTDCVPIYRFYNTLEGSHFYTAVNNEKHQLMSMSYKYRYEGIAGFASRNEYTGGLPVHRFYNKKTGTHFYTASQSEATRVNDTMYTLYRYEGIAYYADAQEQYDSTAMHRFYKFNQGVHFYTPVQSEATTVNNTMSTTYRYEGIPFYVIKNL